MGKHCQGQIEIRLDSIGPTIRSEHHGNIEYRRLSSSDAYKIIGNAVPCVLAYNIAKHISEKWSVYFEEEMK